MTACRRLRVVYLCGGLPADVRHLERAAREVDLIVYRSSWVPPGVAHASDVGELTVSDFAPLVKTGRGHLMFAYPRLARALDRDRPDVVHVLSEPWGLLAVQAAQWTRKNSAARLVLHGCDTMWHHGGTAEQAVRRLLLHRTLSVTSAWAAESSKALYLARRNGLPADSTCRQVHTNPRDDRLFRLPEPADRARARAALGIGVDTTAFGILGRLVPEKGVLLFLEAAERLTATGFPGRFFVAGDGPLREAVAARASATVTPLGPLDHPTGVLGLFTALDVLACPSLTTPSWEDQGPRALLEAMMCGCIPVGTPTGAIPEMIAGQGVVSATTEADALAAAFIQAADLSRDSSRRSTLSAWARSLYSSDAVGSTLVDLWTDVAVAQDGPTRNRKTA